ncbi:MAG: ABC-type transport auxiliary lipoprotein family protein [Rhodocyclaceae bacterium]
MSGRCAIAAAALVAGCAFGPRGGPVATHDFGVPPEDPPGAASVAVREVEVSAPSWLDDAALQYRLAWASATQRHAYRDSRWAAPPGELLAQLLRRSVLAASPVPGAGGCRLRVALEEFEQRFDAPRSSRAVVRARAELLGGRRGAVLAAREFGADRPAANADAAGGAAALSAAARELVDQVRDWLAGMDASGCRGIEFRRSQ